MEEDFTTEEDFTMQVLLEIWRALDSITIHSKGQLEAEINYALEATQLFKTSKGLRCAKIDYLEEYRALHISDTTIYQYTLWHFPPCNTHCETHRSSEGSERTKLQTVSHTPSSRWYLKYSYWHSAGDRGFAVVFLLWFSLRRRDAKLAQALEKVKEKKTTTN